jgi:4-amino-4-deoxy-L-arabinose transferase-like glycosyltransferase
MARSNRNLPAAALATETAPSSTTAAPAVAAPQFGDVLPAFVARTPWLAWLDKLSGEKRAVLFLAVCAAIIGIPWLGATGFWDPWETQYGEVAREMITRGDYLNAWYSYAWFFSKPALDLWLMALGMIFAHSTGPDRYLGVYTEWCVRMPFMIISVMGALMLFVAASRLIGRRAAIFGCLALITAPLFVFLSREAVPDPVLVGLTTAAMACLIIVLFEHEPDTGYVHAEGESWSRRDGWLIAFYIFIGLGTLSKGLLTPGIPGASVLFYCLITGEWHRLRRLRLLTGVLIVLAICAPWYGHMFGFEGRDDEGKSFFERFIIHDHFKRMFLGVHTTTPGGTFIYFIEQLGFECFPWVFAFPGAIARMARARARPMTRRARAELFIVLWVVLGFAMFAFSATKFHHYIFPILPPLLLFCGIWLDDLLEEGLGAHITELLAGTIFYFLVAKDLSLTPKHLTDMFVYNQDRTYPEKEVDPRPFFNTFFFLVGPFVALSPWLFDRVMQSVGLLRAAFSKSARVRLKASVAARMLGEPDTAPEPRQDRRVMVGTMLASAAVIAIYLGWVHWRQLSPHWTQRDLFWTYYQQSTPNEPIAAYQMNWHGETLYSKNTVRQIARSSEPMTSVPDFLAGPGKRKWFLVEQGRLAGLRQVIGSAARLRVVESRNAKFVLAVAEPNPVLAPAPLSPAPQGPGPYAPPGSSGGSPAPGTAPTQGNLSN